MEALFFIHWFHYFYVPASGPWYLGNVWGNAMVILVLAPLGYLWSKTKFWPLRPMKHGFKKVEEHFAKVHAHNEWMARHMAIQHEVITGEKAAPHPHFGRLDSEFSKPNEDHHSDDAMVASDTV